MYLVQLWYVMSCYGILEHSTIYSVTVAMSQLASLLAAKWIIGQSAAWSQTSHGGPVW